MWINGNKYEILDEITKENSNNIFVTNHFYNSPRHGGNAIRLGTDYENFIKFFDLEVDFNYISENDYGEERNFILLKKDLDKYIEEVKDIFKNPPEEFVDFSEDYNGEENFENIKDQINYDYEDIKNKFKKITQSFFEFKMYCKKDNSQKFHLLPILDSSEKFFSLIRKMAIPTHSYFSILKLSKNKKIIYYIKLCFGDITTSKELDNNSENLAIKPNTTNQLWASLNAGQNIILTGVPGTGKTHLATIAAKEVMGEKGYVLTTATSDWTTFDTIGGLIPKDDGKLEFREGKFLQSIRENKWLIIDEINRADIDKAFGQLFTVLSGQEVELPYNVKDPKNVENLIPIKIKSCEEYDSCYDKYTATYYIGKNWRIIATMNSYDKNALFDLSYAFMRRFMIIEIDTPVELDEFINKLKNEEGEIIYDIFCEEYKIKLKNLYKINTQHDIKRKLGPAIFLDILKYLYSRMNLESEKYFDKNNKKYKYDNNIFSEAIIAYVIPQFEGLDPTQYKSVKSFLKNDVFGEKSSDSVMKKLEDMKSFY